MSTNDHPDQETERTQLRVRHRELQPQVGRRGDLSATASAMLCRPPSPPSGTRLFRTTSVNRPETSSSPLARRLDERRIWPASGLQREGLAASPAMGEGTTRDHI